MVHCQCGYDYVAGNAPKMTVEETDRRKVLCALARKELYTYARVTVPKFYLPDRTFAKDMCDSFQHFLQGSDNSFLVVNCPPRFGKSLTAGCTSEWIFGNDPSRRVITGSYNERLAERFARKVRNTIMTPPGRSNRIVFQDIFPGVNVSNKDSSVSMWSLEGSPWPNYLATSPTGTATGMGGDVLIVDDIIKNAAEAYSELAKDNHWEWFANTMMSRLEGNDWKVIIVATRWATDDLAGKVLDNYSCDHIKFKAWEDTPEGRVFTCPSILNEKSMLLKSTGMNRDIMLANYQQEPIDIKGRLYHDFNTYKPSEVTPEPDDVIFSVTDTADKGTDFLCTIVYFVRDGIVYVLDAIYTDSPMEITEKLVADTLDAKNVLVAYTEANNGGRLFARNVRRIKMDKRTVFEEEVTTSNKESRILTSSGWVQSYVWWPEGWKHRWPDMYNEIMSYNAKGKNEHDDAVDALAMIFDKEISTQYATQTDIQ